MQTVQMKSRRLGLMLAVWLCSTQVAANQIHRVEASATAFSPKILFIQPGDTVQWTNMPAHDTVSITGMIPAGAAGWTSKMGENFATTLATPGAYIYKCSPHIGMGMLGAIIVGDERPANLAEIAVHPQNKGMVARTIRLMNEKLAARDE